MDETTTGKTLTEGSSSDSGHRPPMFTGDRSTYKAFISKAKIYLQLNDEKYNTEPKQILVIISYLKDEPHIWAQNWIDEREKDSTGKPKLGTLKDFLEALDQTYKPINFARNALDRLYRLYQGTSRAEEFVNRFKLYAREAGLTINPAATENDPSDIQLVQQFQRALNPSLRERILLETDQPKNLSQWCQRALDRDELFHTMRRQQALFTPRGISRQSTPGRPANIRAIPTEGVTLAKLTEEERKHLQAIKGCYKCRQPGHFARECPKEMKRPPNQKPFGPAWSGQKRKPGRKFSPTAIRALISELEADEFCELRELMDNDDSSVPDSMYASESVSKSFV
jgi:hypothetical protein